MSTRVPTEAQINSYAESFALYGDKTKAFRAAFPASKAKNETLHTLAAKFHHLPQVCSRIKELQEGLKKQSAEAFNLSTSRLKEYLEEAIQKGLANKEIRVGGVVMDGGPSSISGAVSAINEVNKMDGNHAATRIALGGDALNPVQVVSMSKKEYTEARKEMINQDDC